MKSDKSNKNKANVALIQMNCGDDSRENLDKCLARIEEAARQGAHVISTQELFRSRYFCQSEDHANFDLAEPIPGPSTEALAKLAAAHGVVIIGSLFERRAPGLYHNTAVVIDANGHLAGVYRKMHIPDDPLYYEKFYFTPGDLGFKSFDTHYARAGVCVCWDQWYPEAARLTALTGAQILFYPTAIGWHPSEKAEYGERQHSSWETIQRGFDHTGFGLSKAPSVSLDSCLRTAYHHSISGRSPFDRACPSTREPGLARKFVQREAPMTRQTLATSHLCGAICVVIVGLFLATAPATAQSTGATLQGTITDDQGAVMPGATVVITNTETGWTRVHTTDERGWYRAAALPPGVYELRTELSGFANQIRTGLTLTIGQEATINLTLKLATVQETVTVTGATPLVETSKNTLGTTVTRVELDSLPLAGRNFAALANLTPGIAGVGGGGVQASGQTTRSNSYLVDGASNDDTLVASQRGGFSLEAVREFAVMANQFSAEYGLASGAIVSVVTRSGTNTLQGRVFGFHRDDAFDAQNPFSKAQGSGKAPFSQQRFGAFVGGPIFRDKLHYFGAYEGDRQRRTSVVTSTLVPVNEREFPNPSNAHQSFVKSDYRLDDRQSLSLRYRADKSRTKGNSIGGLNTRERGTNNNGLDQDIVANHTTLLSSRALNEFRFQFARRSTFTDTKGWSVDGMPEINRPSGNFGKAYNQPQGRDENRYQFVNMFSYSVNRHEFKAGGDISLIRANAFFPNNRDGIFRFRTDAPFNPSDPSTYPYQYEVNRIDPFQDLPNNLLSFFAQDTWRFRQNLTFNAGVRYDLETAFEELTGVPDDHDNVSPRLGFVWDPFHDGRTAVRGGYGVYIDQSFLNVQLNVAAASRSQEIVIVNPGYPDPFSQGTPAGTAPSTAVIAPRPQIPSSRTVSLGIKREILSGLAVSADGIYSRGYNQFNWIDINYADPVTRRRPDPNRGRVMQYSMEGHAWYRALLVGVEGRARPGRPQWSVAYTLSETIRDVEGFLFTAQDQLNPDAEKSLANNHRKHQLVANVTWSLPGDIQVAAILQTRSGLPWTVTTGVDNNGDTFTVDRPDLAIPGGDPLDRATYFANFTGRVGNLPRNSVIGPDYMTLDARVSKFIRIQRVKIEGFVEAFNVTNRVNYGTPTGNLRSANFGRSTGLVQGAAPRQVELGFRVDF